jgi:hypothetical protein
MAGLRLCLKWLSRVGLRDTTLCGAKALTRRFEEPGLSSPASRIAPAEFLLPGAFCF